MNAGRLVVCSCLAMLVGVACCAEWEDLSVNSIGRLPPRTYSMPLASEADALGGALEPESPYVLSLNGDWKISWCGDPAQRPLDFWKTDFDDSTWGFIDTDRHLEKQGVPFGYKNAWFRTKVEIPEKFRGLRTIAYFRGIDEGCVLYVNGQVAGTLKFDPGNDPDTWKKPMSFDITRFVPADGRIVISMKVINDVNKGGLWQPSELRFMEQESK